MGIRVAIDDFGTGYSSLSLLDRYPISRLKIDRAFIKDLDKPNATHNLVRSMIVMGHTLGMNVVAEGVETVRQAEILTDLGADYAQGFLYAKPSRVEEIPQALAQARQVKLFPSPELLDATSFAPPETPSPNRSNPPIPGREYRPDTIRGVDESASARINRTPNARFASASSQAPANESDQVPIEVIPFTPHESSSN